MVSGSLIDTFLLIVEPFSTPILKKTTHQGNIRLVNKNYSKILEVKNSKEYTTLAHNVKEEVSNPLLRCKVFKEIFCLKLLLLLVFGTTQLVFTCFKFTFNRSLFLHTSS